jgi:hypothetical protein
MEADDAVELGPDAPALELPWQDPEGRWSYHDLRGEAAGPDWERNLKRSIDRIPEAQQFPPLQNFLLKVNSPPSVWETAKCGVLPEKAVPSENPYNAGFAHDCYIDLVLTEDFTACRAELELHRRLAKELAVALSANEALEATAEAVVRRCYFHKKDDPEESDVGYSLTLFLSGYGDSAAKAAENLKAAMELAGEVLVKLQVR